MGRPFSMRRRLAISAAVLGVVIGVGVMPSSPVAAGAILSVGPTFPTSVTVGQTGIAASITIINNNTPPEVASTVCRHDDPSLGPLPECFGAEGIVLTPSCGAQSPTFVLCTPAGADPNVLQIDPAATGSGACAGIAFTAVPLNDLFGNYRFDPPPGIHVVLPSPGATCTINFTFSVLRVPTLDHQPLTPGIQTAQIASASVQADTGALGSGQGTTIPVTILQAVPNVVTNASSGFVLGGGQLSDAADVTGLVNASPPGTVTFRLFGPADATCAGTPVFTDTEPLVLGVDPSAGTAQSAPFTPPDAGTYRWVATYDGDVNNAIVSGTCGDATESRIVAQATPVIATVASPNTALGVGQLSDVATVTGVVNPVGAQTVTFALFGPTDPACAGPPVFTSTVPLVAGTATSAPYTPVDVGIHRWIATYDGDQNNVSVSGTCGDPTETHTAAQATPVIVTVASAGVVLGAGQLSDVATVTGLVNPVGAQTVTFVLFGPADPTCVATPVFTSTVPLIAGSATSAPYTPVDVGTHRWIATYNGDANNAAASGACGAAGETAAVAQAIPVIVTVASPGVVLGAGQLSDVATVTGLVNPVGAQTVAFVLFGPADPTCAGPPVFTSTVPLIAGVATSGVYTPVAAGTHRWIATYNGDANNAAVSGACGAAGETAAVAQAIPAIVTVASPGVVLGAGQLSDVATVTGLVNPVGAQTVTFASYGPADATCAGPPVFTSTVPLIAGTATSTAFTPTNVGTHRWIATYLGDVNNAPVSGACDAAGETAAVTQATPIIVTVASPGVALGAGQLTDVVTVTGLVNPVGAVTVTFDLFGPTDPTCIAAPVFTSTVALIAGTATSGAYAPVDVGTHRWIATYNGDVNNDAVSGTCGAAGEIALVTQATPAIVTVASPGIGLGAGQLSDQATVTGLVNPIGAQTVTFDLYGPIDAACAATPIYTSTVSVINGIAQSASFTPTSVGTYRWIATYVGDVNNASVRGACGAAGETATVGRATPAIVTQASPGVVAGQGDLDDSATVTGLVDPAGPQTVTFRLYGSGDVACSEAPIFTSTVPLTNGAAQSATFTPVTPGTYRWVATYDSDVNNAPVSGNCNDPTETRTVTSPPPVLPHTGSTPSRELIAAWDALALGLVLLASTRRKRA